MSVSCNTPLNVALWEDIATLLDGIMYKCTIANTKSQSYGSKAVGGDRDVQNMTILYTIPDIPVYNINSTSTTTRDKNCSIQSQALQPLSRVFFLAMQQARHCWSPLKSYSQITFLVKSQSWL